MILSERMSENIKSVKNSLELLLSIIHTYEIKEKKIVDIKSIIALIKILLKTSFYLIKKTINLN